MSHVDLTVLYPILPVSVVQEQSPAHTYELCVAASVLATITLTVGHAEYMHNVQHTIWEV